MEFLVQNKEFVLLLGSIIGIIFYFKSLSKDFRTEIKELRTEVRSEIQTLNNRIDGLYNLFSTQNKSK